jgi:hypothetical protein
MRKLAGIFGLTGVVLSLSFSPLIYSQTQESNNSSQTPAANGNTAVSATVPRLVTLNGVIRDRTGRPLTGVVGLRFALYKEQNGTPLWTEVQNTQLDEQGRYTVLLGATRGEGLPTELFAASDSHWLGVQALLPDEEEQPRLLLVSVPYALKAADADTLGGKPLSAFVLSETSEDSNAPDSSEKKLSESDANVFAVSGTGSVNKLPKWQDTAGTLIDSAVFESGGNVGIGTTAPIGTLNVLKEGAPNYITLSAYGADVYDKGFLVRTARGTSSSPQAVQQGNAIFNLYGQGHDGLDYGVAAGISMAVDGAVSVGKVPGTILFQTSNSAGTFAERMRVNSSGNVGIGTASPTAKLDVAGDLNLSSGGMLRFNGAPFLHKFGAYNTFAGVGAGNLTMTGPYNTGVGASALFANTTGDSNTALGALSLAVNTTGHQNSALGAGALMANTTGINNTAAGESALTANTTGSRNTAVGNSALVSNTTGSFSVAVGEAALLSNTASENTAVGYNALQANTTGTPNTAVGNLALYSNTTGSFNNAFGDHALYANTTGIRNNAFGRFALDKNTTGNENIAIGNFAGSPNSTDANVTGSANIFIGFNSGPGTPTQLSNAAAIGANARVSASRTWPRQRPRRGKIIPA